MDYKGLFGKAKKKFGEMGEGDKDLLESLEEDEGLGVVDSGQGGMDETDEYERGEDMVADIERDIEISRNRRKTKSDDELDDLDDLDAF